MLGGNIYKNDNDIFSHILGIGFEFETNFISKLSLNEDKTILVNSNISPRSIRDKILNQTASIFDEHYVKINYLNEKNKLEYLEYLNENESDTVKFQITNDISIYDFTELLKTMYECESNTHHKNELYTYKTSDEKEYIIHFTDEMQDFCYSFAGVEWITTYLNQIPNANIIMEKYCDSCKKIINHLIDLEKIKGNLYILNETTNKREKIGNSKNRYLYHKPNTNLYYLQTDDDLNDFSNEVSKKSLTLLDIPIIPQMTFSCNIIYTIDIIKNILNNNINNFNKSKNIITKMKNEYQIVLLLEKMCNELIIDYDNQDKYYKINNNKNNLNENNLYKIILNYLFLFFYKLYYYINDYTNQERMEEEDYFKNYLSFNTRHSNSELLKEVKNNISKIHTLKDTEKMLESLTYLFTNKKVLIKYLYKNNKCNLNISPDILSNKYKGDPNISFKSYFNKLLKGKDWLLTIDNVSTKFNLKNNIVIIENRFFSEELKVIYKNITNINVKDNYTLKNMIQFVKMTDKLVNSFKNTSSFKKIKNKYTVNKTRKNLKKK